jgi:hypothetical protein
MANEEGQAAAPACEPVVARTVAGCPACGAAMIPLRGQWRCSRCYFMLCHGCEPAAVQAEPAREPRA